MCMLTVAEKQRSAFRSNTCACQQLQRSNAVPVAQPHVQMCMSTVAEEQRSASR